MTTEKEEETKTKTDGDNTEDEVYVDPKTGKRYRKRKEIPSVAYLLAHGNPDTAHLPPSAMQKYGYPVILALLFAISLLIFHHAPHEKSTHPGFQLPQQQQQRIKNENPEMAELIKRNQEMIEEQRRQKKLQEQMEKERERMMLQQQEQEQQQDEAQLEEVQQEEEAQQEEEEEEDGQPEEQEAHQPEQEQETHQPEGHEQEQNAEL